MTLWDLFKDIKGRADADHLGMVLSSGLYINESQDLVLVGKKVGELVIICGESDADWEESIVYDSYHQDVTYHTPGSTYHAVVPDKWMKKALDEWCGIEGVE